MKRKFLLWYNTYPNWHFFRIMLISVICGIIACLIALFVLNSKSVNEKNKIGPGQSWVFEYKIDNPFEKGYRDTIYIVDIKEDYVLYYRNVSPGKYKSERIDWIKNCYYKINE